MGEKEWKVLYAGIKEKLAWLSEEYQKSKKMDDFFYIGYEENELKLMNN